MKIPKLKKYQPIIIEFLDCHSSHMNWDTVENYLKELETKPMIVVGQFISYGKLWLYLCWMIDQQDKASHITEMMKIPVAAIVKIKKLK